jgi:hypothetical protein
MPQAIITSTLVLYLLLCAPTAFPQAQQTDPQTGEPQAGQPADEDLASKVVDPTAILTTLTFQNNFAPSHWGIDDKANQMLFQAVVPFKVWEVQNIGRVRIPYVTSSPLGTRGLSDVALLDILILPREWGTLFMGGVADVGVNKGPGVDTIALGPTVGSVLKKGRWTYGFLNQNLFSADDIATTQVQPILAYTFSKQVSVSMGDLQYTYDWKKDRWVFLPLGFQINYIARLGKQPMWFYVNPQYNLKNEFGSQKWSILIGFAFIVR